MTERVVRTVNRAFPDGKFATWQICERYLPHVLACAGYIDQWNMSFLDAAKLLDRAGFYLQQRAQYDQGELLLQRALAIRELVLEPGHPNLVVSLNNIALLYQAQGQFDQAEPYLQRALNIREQSLGPEHLSVAPILEDYADLLQKMGRKTETAEL